LLPLEPDDEPPPEPPEDPEEPPGDPEELPDELPDEPLDDEDVDEVPLEAGEVDELLSLFASPPPDELLVPFFDEL
jgi:hypothetical protein